MILDRGGRPLAYEVRGRVDGPPVVLFHGAPGSAEFAPPDDVLDRAGVRLVTFDRPGYGHSAPDPDRSLAATAQDALALCDHLRLARVGLVGWSGGGPFATAVAAARPEAVEHLVLVSAPGPLDEVPGGWEALGDYRRPTAEMARIEPRRSARAIGRHMEPFLEHPERFLGTGRGPDGDLLRSPVHGPMLRGQIERALRQGTAGLAADLVAMWQPWGFALGEVRVQTTVAIGAEDPHNQADAAAYAERIPGARLVRWPDRAHLAVLDRWSDILGWASPRTPTSSTPDAQT